MIDNTKQCNEFCVSVVLTDVGFVFILFVLLFSFPFFYLTQPLNTGDWSFPISPEYKLSISRSNSCI